MLVTFTCPAYADITMFGEIAVQLLKLMGHSGTVPSAINAEDIPVALQRLESAIQAEKHTAGNTASPEEDEDGPAVSLAHRALPLIELLKAAAEDQCSVMWDSR